MPSWKLVEEKKPFVRRANVAGRVSNERTGEPVRSATVQVLKGTELVGDTQSDAAGHFYFMRLEDGKYSVVAQLASAGTRLGTARQDATVSGGRSELLELKLSPTVLHGVVTIRGQKRAVPYAAIQVRGTGESAYADAKGEYIIENIQTGKRTVVASAPAYQDEPKTIQLDDAGANRTLNFGLVKAGG